MQTLVSVSAACHSVPVERRNKCLSIRVVCHKMTSRKYTVHCPKKHHFWAHSDQNQNNNFFMHWCECIHSSLINSQFYNVKSLYLFYGKTFLKVTIVKDCPESIYCWPEQFLAEILVQAEPSQSTVQSQDTMPGIYRVYRGPTSNMSFIYGQIIIATRILSHSCFVSACFHP